MIWAPQHPLQGNNFMKKGNLADGVVVYHVDRNELCQLSLTANNSIIVK
jgi:hypothetical protein